MKNRATMLSGLTVALWTTHAAAQPPPAQPSPAQTPAESQPAAKSPDAASDAANEQLVPAETPARTVAQVWREMNFVAQIGRTGEVLGKAKEVRTLGERIRVDAEALRRRLEDYGQVHPQLGAEMDETPMPRADREALTNLRQTPPPDFDYDFLLMASKRLDNSVRVIDAALPWLRQGPLRELVTRTRKDLVALADASSKAAPLYREAQP